MSYCESEWHGVPSGTSSRCRGAAGAIAGVGQAAQNQGTLSCLSVRDCGNLNSAITNKESQSHLMKAYKDLVSPALNQHVYTVEEKCSLPCDG